MNTKILIGVFILTFAQHARATEPKSAHKKISWGVCAEVVVFNKTEPSSYCRKQAPSNLQQQAPNLPLIKAENQARNQAQTPKKSNLRVIATRHPQQPPTPSSISKNNHWFTAIAGTGTIGMIFLIARYLRQ